MKKSETLPWVGLLEKDRVKREVLRDCTTVELVRELTTRYRRALVVVDGPYEAAGLEGLGATTAITGAITGASLEPGGDLRVRGGSYAPAAVFWFGGDAPDLVAVLKRGYEVWRAARPVGADGRGFPAFGWFRPSLDRGTGKCPTGS